MMFCMKCLSHDCYTMLLALHCETILNCTRSAQKFGNNFSVFTIIFVLRTLQSNLYNSYWCNVGKLITNHKPIVLGLTASCTPDSKS